MLLAKHFKVLTAFYKEARITYRFEHHNHKNGAERIMVWSSNVPDFESICVAQIHHCYWRNKPWVVDMRLIKHVDEWNRRKSFALRILAINHVLKHEQARFFSRKAKL